MSKNAPFLDFVWNNRWYLTFSVWAIFFIIYTISVAIGFVPESLSTEPVQTAPVSLVASSTPIIIVATPTKPIVQTVVKATTTKSMVTENPVRIVIDKIGVDTRVSNPLSTSVGVLDEYLRRGAVHYPGSPALGLGNVFIFGHSTGIRVVNNQAYKAFNKLSQLSPGDIVKAYSIDKVYTYRVAQMRLAPASEVFVDFSTKKNMLTLSTCNTFGEKQERYVVEAVFVSVEFI